MIVAECLLIQKKNRPAKIQREIPKRHSELPEDFHQRFQTRCLAKALSSHEIHLLEMLQVLWIEINASNFLYA